MFEGDKEKYKKFLKNLENALAEADIQKEYVRLWGILKV